MDPRRLERIGLVVHPRRPITGALETLEGWSGAHGVELVQVPAAGQERRVAEPGEPMACDVIVALGGDGTTLAAMRTAATAAKPVLGVSCGSLGALTAVSAEDLAEALDRVAAGDWTPRRLPALVVESDGEEPQVGVNDLVIMRQGASQVSASVRVDGELFIRFAGDGLVVATQLGSSAYTLAAGGPVLAPGGSGLVFTPLAPHGGCCPPLVTGSGARLELELDPGFGGARIELDGQIRDRIDPLLPRTLTVTLRPDHAMLVALGGEEPMLAGLRRRRVLMDSPRVLARDEREAAAAPAAPRARAT
jgi:NAD+ kinase